MARIKSLKELGKGSWKIASITPVKANAAKKMAINTENDPQSILFNAVVENWPQAVSEHPAGVPGRKFRIDIAIVHACLAIEFDGYQYHGKFLKDFKRDRLRQNLLVTHGWRVLRFTASDVYQDLENCLRTIETALAMDGVPKITSELSEA